MNPHFTEEPTALEREFPEWMSDIQSQAFQDWIAAQSDAIQQLCGSPLVDDAVAVLSIFHARHEVRH